MENRPPILIGLVNDAEKESVKKFIDRRYLELFNATPPEAQFYFAAWQNGEVVGTMALDFSSPEKELWLEKIYTFNHAETPLPVIPEKIVHFGRWIATVSGVSDALTYAATDFAEKSGRLYGWCEHNDKVHQIAQRFGIIFYPVPNARLLLDRMPPETRTYYTTPPLMRFYMISVPQMLEALRQRVGNMVNMGRIILRS